MFLDGNIPELVECVDVGSLHVYAPTGIFFVCGGRIDALATVPPSLRDVFLRSCAAKKFGDIEVLVAEDLTRGVLGGPYKDILGLESDLAEISDLTILFSEGFGSFAELGAFSVLTEIAEKLVVVIDSQHYSETSFIKLGPVLSLINRFGEGAVYVMNLEDIGLTSINSIQGLDEGKFNALMSEVIALKKKGSRYPTTFKRDQAGHVAKLIVGFIQHYRALTADNIDTILYLLDFTEFRPRLMQLLQCIEFAGWIRGEKRGFNTYYCPTVEKRALAYKLKEGMGPFDRDRWIAQILEHWKISDVNRFSSIQAAMRRSR